MNHTNNDFIPTPSNRAQRRRKGGRGRPPAVQQKRPFHDPPLEPGLVAPDVDLTDALPPLPEPPLPSRRPSPSFDEAQHALAAAQAEIAALRAELAETRGQFAFYVRGAQAADIPWVLAIYHPLAQGFIVRWGNGVENPAAFLAGALQSVEGMVAEAPHAGPDADQEGAA